MIMKVIIDLFFCPFSILIRLLKKECKTTTKFLNTQHVVILTMR